MHRSHTKRGHGGPHALCELHREAKVLRPRSGRGNSRSENTERAELLDITEAGEKSNAYKNHYNVKKINPGRYIRRASKGLSWLKKARNVNNTTFIELINRIFK